MSALLRFSAGAIAAGVCCLPLALPAQQIGTRNTPPGRAQQQAQPAEATQPGQPGAPQLNRPQANRTQPARQQQPYTSNYRGESSNTAAQSSTVEGYLVNCLLKKNKGEIEISQFAAEQTQDPQVKEFAQQVIKDHQNVVEKLRQLAGTSSLDANARVASDRSAIDTTPAPGSSGTDNATLGANDARNATRSNERGNIARPGMQGNAALGQLASIEEKIADRCQQNLKEELQSKSGTDFDQCYVGSQIAGHMQMLAALEVLADEGPGQLKQAAEDTKDIVQQHLDHAKQLANDMKSNTRGPAQAQRPSARTERTE
jgi:predicted outer membrane protein